MDTKIKKNKPALIAVSIGAALCLGLGSIAAASGSAAELSNGSFMVRSVDTEGFEGFAGMKGKPVEQAPEPTPTPTPTPKVPAWTPPAPRIITCNATAKSVYIFFRSYAMPGYHELTLEREIYVDGALVEKTVKEKYASGDVGTATHFLNEKRKATKGYYYAGKSISIAYRILNKRYGPTPWTVADATTNDGGATYQCAIR